MDTLRLGSARYYAVAALAARAALALLGAGRPLLWRPEVATPLNSVLGVREGLFMLRNGLSPYAGGLCHTPPIVLALSAATADGPALCTLPGAAADALAALAFWRLAALLSRGLGPNESGLLLGPAALAAAYLWNPFGLLSTVAGTTTPLENAAVAAALLGGALRNAPLAAAGLAAGAYLGLHPILLAIPLAMMIGRGPEDVTARQEGTGSSDSGNGAAQTHSCGGGSSGGSASGNCDAATSKGTHRVARQPDPGWEPFDWWRVCTFAAFTAAWGAALVALSDVYLRAHPESQCLPRLARWAGGGSGGGGGGESDAGGCWLAATHGFALAAGDYTPNIGLWWYFLTELFDGFRPFFKFVLHSHVLILAAPLALRFPRRPLFVAWALLASSAMLRPYPSAADAAPWMALAPLALGRQLPAMRSGLLLANTALIVAVLGPAMWTQWIVVDAANPNFFYSITLLLGAFYTLVIVQGVLLTSRVERQDAGKPLDVAAAAAAGEGGAPGTAGGTVAAAAGRPDG